MIDNLLKDKSIKKKSLILNWDSLMPKWCCFVSSFTAAAICFCVALTCKYSYIMLSRTHCQYVDLNTVCGGMCGWCMFLFHFYWTCFSTKPCTIFSKVKRSLKLAKFPDLDQEKIESKIKQPTKNMTKHSMRTFDSWQFNAFCYGCPALHVQMLVLVLVKVNTHFFHLVGLS